MEKSYYMMEETERISLQKEAVEKLRGKNWMAAFVLCNLAGCFGAHRFYTGKYITAWIMLIMTFSVICAPIVTIWVVIDCLLLCFGLFKHQDGSVLFEKNMLLSIAYIIILFVGIFKLVKVILS